jgi:outer membrane protein TolC
LDENVRLKAYQTLAAQELAAVAEANIKTLQDHLALVRADEAAGVSTRVDVLRIEAQLEEADAEKIMAEDNVVLARRALNQVIGIEEDNRPISGILPEPDAKKVPADLKLDVSNRADFQAITRKESARDRLNSAAAAFWFPKITVFGQEEYYQYTNAFSTFVLNAPFRNAYNFGIKLSWNIFDGGASIARKAQADNAALQSEQDTRRFKIDAPDEFETWKRRYGYNTVLFKARQRAVEKSKESVRLARIAVRAGSKTNTDLLDAELELFRARAGVIQAQIDAAQALASLELAIGRKL